MSLRELVGCRVELFYADLRLYFWIQNVLTAEFYVNSVTTSGDRLLILGTGYIDSIGTGYSKNDKIGGVFRYFCVILPSTTHVFRKKNFLPWRRKYFYLGPVAAKSRQLKNSEIEFWKNGPVFPELDFWVFEFWKNSRVFCHIGSIYEIPDPELVS